MTPIKVGQTYKGKSYSGYEIIFFIKRKVSFGFEAELISPDYVKGTTERINEGVLTRYKLISSLKLDDFNEVF